METPLTPTQQKEVETVLSKTLPAIEATTLSEHRLCVMLGGQPGAGKSMMRLANPNIVASLGGEFNYATIDADENRMQCPSYRPLMLANDKTAASLVHPMASVITQSQLRRAREIGVNVLYDNTMGTPASTVKCMDEFIQSQYKVDVHVVAVDEKQSWQGVLMRYEQDKLSSPDRTGRMVPQRIHDGAYKGLPETLAQIEQMKNADSITIYNRAGQVLYRNELINGEWKEPARAAEALKTERERPLSVAECTAYARRYENMMGLQSHPDRNASAEEIATTKKLQAEAQQMLAAAVAREAREAQQAEPQQKAIWPATAQNIAVAKARETEPRTLTGLASLNNSGLNGALVRNPSTPAEALAMIANAPSTNAGMLMSIIGHANTSPALLGELTKSRHEEVRMAAETALRELKVIEEQRTKSAANKEPEKGAATNERPKMVIVAGPQKAGKSTLIDNDPELKAMTRITETMPGVDGRTGKACCAELTAQAIADKKSFLVESSLDGKRIVELAKAAEKAGYDVHVVGVGLAPAIAAERAAGQQADRVADRYTQSMANLTEASKHARSVRLFDGGAAKGNKPELLALFERGKDAQLLGNMPDWLNKTGLANVMQLGRGLGTGRELNLGGKDGGLSR